MPYISTCAIFPIAGRPLPPLCVCARPVSGSFRGGVRCILVDLLREACIHTTATEGVVRLGHFAVPRRQQRFLYGLPSHFPYLRSTQGEDSYCCSVPQRRSFGSSLTFDEGSTLMLPPRLSVSNLACVPRPLLSAGAPVAGIKAVGRRLSLEA